MQMIRMSMTATAVSTIAIAMPTYNFVSSESPSDTITVGNGSVYTTVERGEGSLIDVFTLFSEPEGLTTSPPLLPVMVWNGSVAELSIGCAVPEGQILATLSGVDVVRLHCNISGSVILLLSWFAQESFGHC